MKKIILSVFCCFLAWTAMAQTPFNFGVHVGWNNTKINVRDFKVNSHNGYKFGLFSRIHFDKIYLEPSLDWVHRETEVNKGGKDGKLKSNSLDIPVLVGTNLLRLPVFNLRLYTGPMVSFILNDMKITDVNGNVLKAADTMWYLRFGAGIDLWNITFDVNHEFGLKNFGNNIKTPKTWNLTLGFKII